MFPKNKDIINAVCSQKSGNLILIQSYYLFKSSSSNFIRCLNNVHVEVWVFQEVAPGMIFVCRNFYGELSQDPHCGREDEEAVSIGQRKK